MTFHTFGIGPKINADDVRLRLSSEIRQEFRMPQVSIHLRTTQRSRLGHVRQALTLVEILVVIAIIGVLLAILLPAVQSARASANNTACLNNLRQIGLGVQQYESTHKKLPRGVHTDILAYLEAERTHSWTPPSILLCPSENRRDPNPLDASRAVFVLGSNYAYSRGRWVVDTHSESPFSGRYRADQVKDGLTNTLCASEVKLGTDLLQDARGLGGAIPTDPTMFQNVAGTRYLRTNGGIDRSHTRWNDMAIEQSGFTTTFPPNTFVPLTDGDVTYDINVVDGSRIFAAVTARSWHGPWVNVVFLDARVRSISNSIRAKEWQALSTPMGQESMDTLP